jgi:outer membrane protein
MLPAVAAAGLLFGAAPAGCSGLDLPTALQRVADRSDEVAIKAAEQAGAEADLALARAVRYVPAASATFIAGPAPAAHGTVVQQTGGTSNRSLNDLEPFVRLDASVVQPLWTWGQLDAARDAATAGVSARGALVMDAVSRVQLRVAQLFWAHVLARRLLAIAASVDKALAEVDQRIAKALESKDSSIGPNDHYRVDVFRAELARRKAEAQKALEMADIGIAASLAMETRELELADIVLPAPTTDVPELAQLVEKASLQRPDLSALTFAIDAQRAQVRADEAARLPQLFLAGQFSVAYAGNRDLQTNPWVYDPFREVSGGLVLGIKQNLSLHVLQAELEKARAAEAVLARQLEGMQRLVRVQVEQARSELVASTAQCQASQQGLTAAKSWFRAVELNFGVGVEDAKTLIDSYRSYVENQVSLASSQYQLAAARAQLDQAIGAPIGASLGACRERTP